MMTESQSNREKPFESKTGRGCNFKISTLLVLTFIVALMLTILRPFQEVLPKFVFLILFGYCLVLTAYGVFRLMYVWGFLNETRKKRKANRAVLREFVKKQAKKPPVE